MFIAFVGDAVPVTVLSKCVVNVLTILYVSGKELWLPWKTRVISHKHSIKRLELMLWFFYFLEDEVGKRPVAIFFAVKNYPAPILYTNNFICFTKRNIIIYPTVVPSCFVIYRFINYFLPNPQPVIHMQPEHPGKLFPLLSFYFTHPFYC